MSPKKQSPVSILAECESKGSPRMYVCDPEERTTIPFDAQGREVFVVSDLHLAAGRSSDGNYEGTENFFADDSFDRFLSDLRNQRKGMVLVINGDFVDFLRVDRTPRHDSEYAAWEQELSKIGIAKSAQELRDCIVPKERTYGLKTDDYKSIWKLFCAVQGHSQLFSALADWIAAGEWLVIVKGNHDLEWYWAAVRNYLRYVLADLAAKRLRRPLDTILQQTVVPNLWFVDDALLVDKCLYIEHGHRYDKFSNPIGAPVLNHGKELNLPFGSFFNRYLVNQVELAYPFIDNVRPREKLLPLLVRERFPLALRVMFNHIPLAIFSVQKQYFRYMFSKVFTYGLAIGVPLILVLVRFYSDISAFVDSLNAPTPPGLTGLVFDQISRVGHNSFALIFAYALARVVAFFQLDQPSSLVTFARQCLNANPDCRFVTFGHTHDPEQFRDDDRWYHNTGTWIPIIDVDSAEIREDKTYTFLHYRREANGEFASTTLDRWDDEAGRSQPLVLLTSKDQPSSGPW